MVTDNRRLANHSLNQALVQLALGVFVQTGQDLTKLHQPTYLSICGSHFASQDALNGTLSSAGSWQLKLASAIAGCRIQDFGCLQHTVNNR